MSWRSVPALSLLLASCASAQSGAPARGVGGGDGAGGQTSAAEGSVGGASSDSASPGEPAREGAARRVAPGTPLDDREPDPKGALPRVSVRHIGMHIGGDPNTPESKRPFLRTLEGADLPFLHCYRRVDSAAQGGTFGADLFIAASGGAPEVRAVRQKLGGDDFVACMTEALGGLRFPAGARATVVSYSLRFDVE